MTFSAFFQNQINELLSLKPENLKAAWSVMINSPLRHVIAFHWRPFFSHSKDFTLLDVCFFFNISRIFSHTLEIYFEKKKFWKFLSISQHWMKIPLCLSAILYLIRLCFASPWFILSAFYSLFLSKLYFVCLCVLCCAVMPKNE